MTMPRKKIDRWRQILCYLVCKFPPPFPVELVFNKGLDPGDIAESYELIQPGRRRIYILMDSRRTWRDGNHDLLHEYAHAMTWPVSKQQLEHHLPHLPEFWAAYGRIYVDFFDGDGAADSRDY